MVSASILRKSLFKGSFFAVIGGFFLLLAGSFFSLSLLQRWGFVIYFISIALIVYGLLPYKRLVQLQLKPTKVIYNPQICGIDYFSKNTLVFSIPFSTIKEIKYCLLKNEYGILLWLHHPIENHVQSRELEKIKNKAHQLAKADFYLPYFNRASYCELKEWVQSESTFDDIVQKQ